MTFPYMIQRIKRQPLGAVLLLTLNLVTALLLCILHTGGIRLEKQIDAVYENTTITCQVSNLTGTQTEELHLPEWVIRLFMGKSSVPNSHGISYGDDEEAAIFQTYIEDIQAKVSIRGKHQGSTIRLVGLTGVDADRALGEDYGGYISWQEGYGEEIFFGRGAYCLVPEALLPALPDSGMISLSFFKGEDTVTRELAVVGTHTGGEDTIYCPWDVTIRLNQEIDGSIHADSISAVLVDSRAITEFWEKAAGNYFVEPNAKGGQTIWEESPVYGYYPYALLVNDDVLEETVSRLQNNLSMFRLCTVALIALSLILGVVVGHSIVRQRVKTLALQRVLGQSDGNIFGETWLELTTVTALGILAGIGAGFLTGIRAFPWSALLASLVFYILGIASAIFAILRTDLIRSIKEDA